MTDMTIATAGGETRQAMLRVWMAISSVWVTFWLAMAILIMLAGDRANPLAEHFGLFTLVVLAPPFCLFAIGAASRWIFETARKLRRR